MSEQLGGDDVSWTGLGVGTTREAFLRVIRATLPDYPPEEAARAVLCSLLQRLSGGLAQRILDELTDELRPLARTCAGHAQRPAPAGDKDDLYGAVAEHLQADAADARRILSAVFSGLHSQVTAATSERIASELPAGVADTWLSARRRVHPRG